MEEEEGGKKRGWQSGKLRKSTSVTVKTQMAKKKQKRDDYLASEI